MRTGMMSHMTHDPMDPKCGCNVCLGTNMAFKKPIPTPAEKKWYIHTSGLTSQYGPFRTYISNGVKKIEIVHTDKDDAQQIIDALNAREDLKKTEATVESRKHGKTKQKSSKKYKHWSDDPKNQGIA